MIRSFLTINQSVSSIGFNQSMHRAVSWATPSRFSPTCQIGNLKWVALSNTTAIFLQFAIFLELQVILGYFRELQIRFYRLKLYIVIGQ